MVKKLSINNFKSHRSTTLPLSGINVLTGLNGVGKSSVIQALLLLRQSYEKGLLSKGVELMGTLCEIGTASDAIYQYADSDEFSFEIETQAGALRWTFRTEITSLSDTFVRLARPTPIDDPQRYFLFDSGFQYISAFRNGPVNDYKKDTASVELLGQISQKEGRCELVAHFLHHFKDKEVDGKVALVGGGTSLLSQVEIWMQKISPNINIHVEPTDTSYRINYSYDRGDGLVKTENFRASNIGFGVSYSLPIVVAILQACLIADKKEGPHLKQQQRKEKQEKLIVIENPEAHIHPSGQSNLMTLVALAAAHGVQFIIETHSDHVINGLLVEVKKATISHEDLEVYYFDRDQEKHCTKVLNLDVLPQGRIKHTPPGFFDQIDLDMEKLLGF
jgi:predicted ATPase